jgi:hypothetical protein
VGAPSARTSASRRAPAPEQQPVALLYGPGQRIVHGNPAFVAEFGKGTVGLPAREALLDLPALVFEVVDRVLATGRPLACSLDVAGERRRLTVAPRLDPETGEIYGVAIRLAHGAKPTV